MHRRRAGKIAAAALLAAVVVIAGYLAFRYLNLDAARELVVQRLETVTGREVVIEGDFDLVTSLAPTLAARSTSCWRRSRAVPRSSARRARSRMRPWTCWSTDLDILRALPHCMIVELDIEAGVAQTEATLDTQRMTLLGQGTLDIGEAQLDLALRPKAKQKKLSRLAVPVDITGSFAEPEVSPRAGRAVGQAIRGVLGGLLIPLNQLSAPFGKETVDACRQALEQIGELPDPPAVGESPS